MQFLTSCVCLGLMLAVCCGVSADETQSKSEKGKGRKVASATQKIVSRMELTDIHKEQVAAIDKEPGVFKMPGFFHFRSQENTGQVYSRFIATCTIRTRSAPRLGVQQEVTTHESRTVRGCWQSRSGLGDGRDREPKAGSR